MRSWDSDPEKTDSGGHSFILAPCVGYRQLQQHNWNVQYCVVCGLEGQRPYCVSPWWWRCYLRDNEQRACVPLCRLIRCADPCRHRSTPAGGRHAITATYIPISGSLAGNIWANTHTQGRCLCHQVYAFHRGSDCSNKFVGDKALYIEVECFSTLKSIVEGILSDLPPFTYIHAGKGTCNCVFPSQGEDLCSLVGGVSNRFVGDVSSGTLGDFTPTYFPFSFIN